MELAFFTLSKGFHIVSKILMATNQKKIAFVLNFKSSAVCNTNFCSELESTTPLLKCSSCEVQGGLDLV
jgi:hypothetical protein